MLQVVVTNQLRINYELSRMTVGKILNWSASLRKCIDRWMRIVGIRWNATRTGKVPKQRIARLHTKEIVIRSLEKRRNISIR